MSLGHESNSGADILQAVISDQRRELMWGKSLESDLDLAFNLQLQEAITASLALHHHDQPSTSLGAASSLQSEAPLVKEVSSFTDIQSGELVKLEQELKDHAISETEFRKLKNEIQRRVHDRRLALEISRISEGEWDEWGDNFERPFGEGCSKGDSDEIFRICFKGLVENQSTKGNIVGGIGIAICDSADALLFELRKPLFGNWMGRRNAEFCALIEALNTALELELSRVAVYFDYYPLYNYVTGNWSARQRKAVALLKQVSQLQEKFTYFQPYVVARNDVKYAFKLAREAIISQMNKPADVTAASNLSETCAICLEDTNVSEIFSVDNCNHRYCFSCMKQHVEVKLLHGILPACPHEGCKTALKVDSCGEFLTSRLIDIMSHRIMEASIPVTEKVYCPYPKCSALMSKKEALEHSVSAFVGAERSGARKCLKCSGIFCINCRVPWHSNMTCFDYKRRNPYPQLEEAKLKNLAATNLWRQCMKCNHMIELAAGCYHMTCRCGYEFCYTCGAEWKNKKATCACPLWDEQNIIEDMEEEEEDEDEVEDDYDSDSDEYVL